MKIISISLIVLLTACLVIGCSVPQSPSHPLPPVNWVDKSQQNQEKGVKKGIKTTSKKIRKGNPWDTSWDRMRFLHHRLKTDTSKLSFDQLTRMMEEYNELITKEGVINDLRWLHGVKEENDKVLAGCKKSSEDIEDLCTLAGKKYEGILSRKEVWCGYLEVLPAHMSPKICGWNP